MCKRVLYKSQQHLTLHYHHSKNLFSNPSPQYQSTVEESFNFKLSPQNDVNPADDVDSDEESDQNDEYNELFVPVW
jgi:hypothetical protein